MKQHNSNAADSKGLVDVYKQDETKFVNCHLKLSPVADRQLVKIQQLLRNENIKLSKTGVINILLENLKTECFLGDISKIIGNRVQNKIAQVFLDSDMNDEDLEILKKMERNKKK
ncbi:hypothetical protein [Klebsiella grimontii]|uniref:hypothetical protein n=1 Tax=Klebsiella grimontii TaxID=2058152 RepID=UPI0012B8A166|nr:hypothetical protein [Klebsiella grimontii]